MQVLKKDSDRLAEEKELLHARADLAMKRSAYLETLRKNGRFQKFVIDDIIRKNLTELTDLNKIPVGEFEEMGKMAFQAMAARKTLEKILGELLNP